MAIKRNKVRNSFDTIKLFAHSNKETTTKRIETNKPTQSGIRGIQDDSLNLTSQKNYEAEQLNLRSKESKPTKLGLSEVSFGIRDHLSEGTAIIAFRFWELVKGISNRSESGQELLRYVKSQ